MMATILVTNDDGVDSPGLLALSQALAGLGELLVLAPERNWSASGHAKTMHKPLRIKEVTLADGRQAHASSGSPTDCVALAIGGVLGSFPDIVVSGINSGYNLGADITYSGTVAGAMEARIKGIPGIAVSTDVGAGEDGASLDGLQRTGQIAAAITAEVLARGLPQEILLNVNVPASYHVAPKGVRITRMGKRHYPAGELVERQDPWGRPYYWLGGVGPVDDAHDGTDIAAVRDGYLSITPISLDMTDRVFLAALAGWTLEASIS